MIPKVSVLALLSTTILALEIFLASSVQSQDFDCASGDVECLVDAIKDANASKGDDVINLASGVYSLTRKDNDTDGPNGLPSITGNITINGNGASIEGTASYNDPYRIFHVAAGGRLELNDVTVAKGSISECCSGPFASSGGGIYVAPDGKAVLNHTTVRGNDADGGAGIYNRGTMEINNSAVRDNDAYAGSGGIYNMGTMEISNSTIADNGAFDVGGIGNEGKLTVTNSVIRSNSAEYTGGISNSEGGLVVLNNTTLTDQRTSEYPSVIDNYGTMELNNTIIRHNAPWIFQGAILNRGSIVAQGSTIADNGGTNCVGNPVISQGEENLDDDGSCFGVGIGPSGEVIIQPERGDVSSPEVLEDDFDAQGGAYISATSGNNTSSPKKEASSTFSVPKDGTYFLWARLYGPDKESDAMYIGIDGSWSRVYPEWTGDYLWVRVPVSRRAPSNFAFNLSKGTHEINIGHAELNARLDALVVTDDPELHPLERPLTRIIQAEEGDLRSPMEVGRDSNAQGGHYISVSSGTDTTSPAKEASYSFSMPEEGIYYLWALMKGADEDSDAMYIGIDGSWSRVYPQDVLPYWRDHYHWARVAVSRRNASKYGFHLSKGSHEIQVGHAELNARLDALAIMDDPTTAPDGIYDDRVTFEDIRADFGELNPPMEVIFDINAPRGVYVSATSASATTSPEREASYEITVPREGIYYLWARLYGPDEDSDAFYIGIDGSWDRVYPDATAKYMWERVEISDRSGKYGFRLEEGWHEINVGHGEPNARLEGLILTDVAEFHPQDTPETPDVLLTQIQAEDGEIRSPMEIGFDIDALEGAYISATSTSATRSPQKEASYSFSAPEEGTYYLWARMLGPDAVSDAIYIGIDGSWSRVFPDRTGEYRWVRVGVSRRNPGKYDFNLGEGSHEVQVGHAEPDARLDALLVTDDSNFRP